MRFLTLRKPTVLDFLVFLFVVSALPALWVGYAGLQGIPTLVALSAGGLVYFAVSRLAGYHRWWRVIAGGLVGVGGLIAVYFITQAGRLEYADKVEAVFRLSRWLSDLFPAFPIWRPQTNSIGTFLAGVIVLCVPLASGKASVKEKWIWRGFAFVIGLAIVLSASRGAWLALAFAGSAWLALYWRPVRWLLLFTGAAVLCLAIWVVSQGSFDALAEFPLLSSVLSPIFNRPDRFGVIWNSLLLAKDYPLTGIGLASQFGFVYSRYQLYMPYVFLTYAHNLYLQIWLEQGLLGLVVWMSLVTTVVTRLWLSPPDQRFKKQAAAWAGLLAILTHGLVDARMVEDLWCWLPFFVLLGLLASGSTSQERGPFPWFLRWAPLGVPIICVLFAVMPDPAAAVSTNLGALLQMRADLTPEMSPGQKSEFLQRASKYFQQSLAFRSDQRGANYRLGLIALENLEFEQAILYFESAHPSGSGHTGLKKALGLAYTFSGMVEEGRPLLVGQIDIVNELNYWGYYFGRLQKMDASRNAYLQADLVRSGQSEP